MKTTKHIGFTNKYFTLWSITSDSIYYENGTGYDTVSYTFIQNLSMSYDDAIIKAKEMGVVDISVDNDLNGKKSWKLSTKVYDVVKISDEKLLRYAFYDRNTSDIDKKLISDKLISEFSYGFVDNVLYNSEDYKNYLDNKNYSNIVLEYVNSGEKKVIMDSNLKSYESIGTLRQKLGDSKFSISIIFDNVKTMNYNGFYYALPIIDGKAKRVKNKEIAFTPILEGDRVIATNIRLV